MPGLAAKPIVDMLVVVVDSADEDAYLPAMENSGYVLRVREPEFEEHGMFRTPELDVHVHVLSDGSPEIERYLRFHALRAAPFPRARCQTLKLTLAAQDWQDMNADAARRPHRHRAYGSRPAITGLCSQLTRARLRDQGRRLRPRRNPTRLWLSAD